MLFWKFLTLLKNNSAEADIKCLSKRQVVRKLRARAVAPNIFREKIRIIKNSQKVLILI